jgi:archaellum biogenesis ATPase FlaH
MMREGAMMSEGAAIQTGIKGLDEILLGGIPLHNTIVVEGETGTCKTLLGMEFIYRGVTEFDEPGMIVIFETSAQKLIRDAAAMGWDFEDLQARRKLQVVFTSPEVLDQEVRSPDSLLMETAAEIGAHRIFIDGIGLLSQASQSGVPRREAKPDTFRELLQQVIEALSRENLTTMLSHETGSYRGGGEFHSGSRRIPSRYRDQAGHEDPRRARSSHHRNCQEPWSGLRRRRAHAARQIPLGSGGLPARAGASAPQHRAADLHG